MEGGGQQQKVSAAPTPSIFNIPLQLSLFWNIIDIV
ncbi:MAG: hypothetical protein ACFWUM_06145 [Eubacteriales bacterium]|jgi:hypothetical protein